MSSISESEKSELKEEVREVKEEEESLKEMSPPLLSELSFVDVDAAE